VQREVPVSRSCEPGGAYWDFAYIRHLGFRPQTIIDVGVGLGTPQLYAAFPDAQLLLVEPLAEFFEGISQTLARRRGVHIPAAAWSSAGEVEVRVEPRWTEGSSHYLRHPIEKPSLSVALRRVPAITIDGIIARHDFPTPFALKIDTEGAELEVIRGASATLERTLFVIAEVSVLHNRFQGSYSFAQFIAAMDQAGFEVCDLLRVGRAPSSQVIDVDLVFQRQGGGL
jgi:FkbM family methyltransferase